MRPRRSRRICFPAILREFAGEVLSVAPQALRRHAGGNAWRMTLHTLGIAVRLQRKILRSGLVIVFDPGCGGCDEIPRCAPDFGRRLPLSRFAGSAHAS